MSTRPTRATCVRAREWASLGLDGELSEFERILLGSHLERCASCRAFAAEAEAVTHALRGARLEPVAVQVAGGSRRTNALRLRRAPLVAAAALVLSAAGLGGALGTLRTDGGQLDRTLSFSPIIHSPAGDPLMRDLRLASLKPDVPPPAHAGIGATKPPLPVNL